MANKKWYNPLTWFASDEVAKGGLNKINPLARYNLSYADERAVPFEGTKNPGMLGPVLNYQPQHYRLSTRSWQAALENPIARIGIKRHITWTIGKGLKVQSEPVMLILEDAGIKLDKKKFSKSVEAYWNLYRSMNSIDYAGRKTLNQLTKVWEKHAKLGGDVLIIIRVIKGEMKVQTIDSHHVQSPEYGSESWPKDLPNGNMIIDGVEKNSKGEHIAYWVKAYAIDKTLENRTAYKFERVEAWGKKTGMRMAYLYYGDEHRIDDTRGLPFNSTFLEKLQNMDQYSGAALQQAKAGAEVDYQVVHEKDAPGNSPWAMNTVNSANGVGGAVTMDDNAETNDGVEKMNRVHLTGMGMAFNLPPGAEIKTLENKNQLYFKDFNTEHRNEYFAGLELPPNVAMSKYDDSFSASRAAVMDWAHTLFVGRDEHFVGAQKPVFDMWLYLMILNGTIQAPGYLTARREGKWMVIAAYHNVRMVGATVPHIDPLKEVAAARAKLGAAGASMPLGDLERVTEDLGMGDAAENVEQFAEELANTQSLNIRPEPVLQQVTDGNNDPSKDKKNKKKKPD